jgi:hypothetical protein
VDGVWAKVLGRLREKGEHSLFALVSDLNGIEFTDSSIIITADSDAEYRLLTANRGKLNRLAGGDYIAVQLSGQDKTADETAAKLRELFGEKFKK